MMKRSLCLSVLLVACIIQRFTASAFTLTMKTSVVVISPPGDNVGQVAAVKAATMGNAVKWFVVSSESSGDSASMSLAPDALQAIQQNGGSVELAGASAESLVGENAATSIAAVQQWCQDAQGLLCCMDGVDSALKGKIDEEDPKQIWKSGIKVAAQEASKTIRGMKLAILSADDTDDESDENKQQANGGGGMGSLLKSVVGGGNKPDIPSSLLSAMSAGEGKVVKLRHGELFGIPESSPNFSALVGGPRKDAMLCEEYTMRSIRMDPSLSVTGGTSGARSSRLAVGEAASLLVSGKVPISTPNLDVCVSSQVGTDVVELETWQAELQRVEKMLQSGQGAQLFTASFSSVPNVERLADWLATKWAPAVLRTYDIAAIRVGARPVYASRSGEPGQVEIVWQQLQDDTFESVTAGKMLIQVSNEGLVATRGAGDASKGFGSISRKPLAGETVLVRRLADAASQAIEKGLANKPITAKKPKPVKKKAPEPVVVTSVQSSGTVPQAAEASSSDTGPRTAGARRSSERARGGRKTRKSTPPTSTDDADSFQ